MPEQYFDPQKGIRLEEFGKHYSELMTRDAAEQVRRNALPQKPEDYKLELPKDFKLPEGLKYELATDAPEMSRFRELAVKKGFDQETVTDLMGLYAETQVASQQRIEQAKAAEVQKLGSNGPSRVTAIENWVRGMLGDQDARTLMLQGMYTAAGTAAFERLIGKVVSQGSGSYSRAHTEPPEQGRVSDEQWNSMGPGERLAYARNFDQSRFTTNGTGR